MTLHYTIRWPVRALAIMTIVVAPGLMFPAATAAQATGTVTGSVVDAGSGQPLAGVQIYIVGTTRGGLTNQEGRYLIPQVPAGRQQVGATIIGYRTETSVVTVSAGGTATADFRLATSVVQLGGVVVTATGRQQTKREIGSSVGVVQTNRVELATIPDFSTLIQGRTAGVSVSESSGQTGSGARIRIRGSNSVSLSNSPLLIVDGVRVDSDPQSYDLFNGGQTASRLNDFNPEEIESVEILRGPSAAALYGTAAANGVVQITTRRGHQGSGSWRFWSEGNVVDRNVSFPANYWAVQHNADGTDTRCDNLRLGQGGCTVNQVYRFNPLEDTETTPFRTGVGRVAGLSFTGGGDVATYFLSGEFNRVTGALEANDQQRVTVRANVGAAVRENLRVSAKAGYVDSNVQFPQNDNSAIGILLNGLLGVPTPSRVEDPDLQGFRLPRNYPFAWANFQNLTRFTGSTQAHWQPYAWLSVNSTVGVDDVARFDNDLVPPDVLALFGPPFSSGFRETSRYSIRNYTATGDMSATFDVLPTVVSTSSGGVQYFREVSRNTQATGTDLTPGTSSLHGASAGFGVDEVNIENRTLGAYLQQQLAWRDRVFLNGAVRGDRNSAFGTNLGWIFYPSVSGSWLMTDESFFPRSAALSSLRLRAAWGQSGLRPGFRDAIQYFQGVTAARVDGAEPGFVISGAGNPDLKPERSSEIEVGFDAGFLQERLGLELTYYDKRSRDALVQRTLAPSLGATANRFENIGQVQNRGFELTLNADLLQGQRVRWNLGVTGSTVDNKVLSLGDVSPIVLGFNSTQQIRAGYPAGGYWQKKILGYSDDNGNGVLDLGEVQVSDSVEYLGSPFPDRELALTSTVTLFDRVRLTGLLDYRGGNKIYDLTHDDRCTASSPTCEERQNANASLADQARYVAVLQSETHAGYIEDASFWKLRELSATFLAPPVWARRLGVHGLSLTLAGRNLFTWTPYRGLDPEVSGAGQANFTTVDNTTLPPLRSFTARIEVNF